jgi:RNA polymerase sigma-70 factor (ECF subfamily)
MRMMVSDENLARAAADGDADAFATLIERRYDDVFRLAFRLTGARAEAEDLAQDVCAALPLKLRGYRGDARFTTWLYRVVVNAAHDRRRRTAIHARHAQSWGDWEIDRRAAQAQTAEALDWLTEAMRALPDELRDTFALVLDDVTHEQAAEVMGVAPGTIAWRVSEAKKTLRVMREREERI